MLAAGATIAASPIIRQGSVASSAIETQKMPVLHLLLGAELAREDVCVHNGCAVRASASHTRVCMDLALNRVCVLYRESNTFNG